MKQASEIFYDLIRHTRRVSFFSSWHDNAEILEIQDSLHSMHSRHISRGLYSVCVNMGTNTCDLQYCGRNNNYGILRILIHVHVHVQYVHVHTNAVLVILFTWEAVRKHCTDTHLRTKHGLFFDTCTSMFNYWPWPTWSYGVEGFSLSSKACFPHEYSYCLVYHNTQSHSTFMEFKPLLSFVICII